MRSAAVLAGYRVKAIGPTAAWFVAFLLSLGSGACVETESDMGPVNLPIRAEDAHRFPRDDFGFVFETGHGEKIDTFSGLVTKDLVTDPDTSIALELTEAELDTIYRKMIAIRLFEFPEVIPMNPGIDRHPSMTMYLKVRAGHALRTIYWKTGAPDNSVKREWEGLLQLITLIRQVTDDHAEYQALPPARGVYY